MLKFFKAKELHLLSKKVVAVAALAGTVIPTFGQKPVLQTFPLSAVSLKESPFKEAERTDLKYILSLNPDRLLAPYLKEAGLTPLAKSYGNWENTGLDGHIGGHYLTALAEMVASAKSTEAEARLTYMIDWLEKCQAKNGDGYVGGVPNGKAMWTDIGQGKIDAGTFSLNSRWVPLYNIHKTFAGLRDAYLMAGNEKAKTVLIKLTDWFYNLTAPLTDTQVQTILKSEHGGLNEVFADVSEITGDEKYLKLARRFSDVSILDPLLAGKDQLNGMHANTQIPKVIGYKRVSELDNDKTWSQAAGFFWNTVVNNRTISIGGNSVREHFNPTNDFSSMVETREGPETCNSYNMLKLSKALFLTEPASKYLDYYERTVYNHILSSQHPEGGFVYFTPIRPRHYRVYSEPQESFWCCVGSGLENHGKYGELIYAHTDKDLYVNLFIPSVLNWKEKGLTLSQDTRFPFEEKSSLKFTLSKAAKFAVKLRYPSWVANGKMKVMINGKETAIQKDANSYVTIDRNWKSGDVLTIALPMETKAEQLPDKSAWVSFVHGPIVLAAATDTSGLVGLHGGGTRMGHIASGPIYPMEEAPLLVSDNVHFDHALQPVNGKSFTFTAANVIHQDKYKDLQLVPFYQIHDARYVIYFPFTTKEGLPLIQKTIREKEELRMKLEASTVDLVTAGEQQPESDHGFKGERTETGTFRERHYRNGSGWFSYEMRNADAEATKLSFTYFGAERNRAFDVLVNGKVLAEVVLDGSEGDKFLDKVLELPKAAGADKGRSLLVEFRAKEGSRIAAIYEVRLLR